MPCTKSYFYYKCVAAGAYFKSLVLLSAALQPSDLKFNPPNSPCVLSDRSCDASREIQFLQMLHMSTQTFHLTAYIDNLTAHNKIKSLAVYNSPQFVLIKPYEACIIQMQMRNLCGAPNLLKWSEAGRRLGAQHGFAHLYLKY